MIVKGVKCKCSKTPIYIPVMPGLIPEPSLLIKESNYSRGRRFNIEPRKIIVFFSLDSQLYISSILRGNVESYCIVIIKVLRTYL